MEYTILHDVSSRLLEILVNQYIDKGWKPQGGIMIIVPNYYQAMIREK